MKPSIVIVGAGLGGCFLANELAETWDVTVVEIANSANELQKRIRDIGKKAILDPIVGSGLGGTTTVWHNGLIEVEDEVFQRRWPFSKDKLAAYYAKAFSMLSGVSRDEIYSSTEILKRKLEDCEIPIDLLGQTLTYPKDRLNVWNSLKLEARVNLIIGEASDFIVDENHDISRILIISDGSEIKIGADFFILSAGGLGTPLLLKKLAEIINLPGAKNLGFNYDDHPLGFVADFEYKAPLYKLWNFKHPGSSLNMRIPMVIRMDGLLISFQLRPAVHFTPRNRVRSVLNNLRNKPFDLKNYLQIFLHLDDVLDILSFKFGVHFPTKNYTLLMVAEQPPSTSCCVWSSNESKEILRNWILPPEYICILYLAINQVFKRLGDKASKITIFPDLQNNLSSSAHHSGTARMSSSDSDGVCDENGKVYGLENLYICDGSLIPGSGYANTGLTIAALALRMADMLNVKSKLGPITAPSTVS